MHQKFRLTSSVILKSK